MSNGDLAEERDDDIVVEPRTINCVCPVNQSVEHGEYLVESVISGDVANGDLTVQLLQVQYRKS